LLLFEDSKSVGGRMSDDQAADIAQHRLEDLRRVRLRGDQNPMYTLHVPKPRLQLYAA
jgi:hypothetical protein